MISSAVWIHYMIVTDRQTDGQTLEAHGATAKNDITHSVAR